jgi:hypothetical protein
MGRLFAIMAVLLAVSIPCLAGGPVCPPPMCGPQPCMPPACMPQPCAPPMACAPPPCMPMPCGPQMCCPPKCGPGCDDCLSALCKGAVKLVAGVISLPFKLVDCLFSGPNCPPRPMCRPMTACAPQMCCPPPPCGMPPAMGCGMPMGNPYGFGYGGPRPAKRMAPFAKNKTKALPDMLMAAPTETIFGACW